MVFVLQSRVTSSPSITGRTGLCRITDPPQHRDKLQHFIHLHTASSTLTPHTQLTSDCQVNHVTDGTLSGLTPVNSTVQMECNNVTSGTNWFSPPISTLSPLFSSCVSPQSPSSRAVVLLTAQRHKVSFKELRAAGTHSQTSCEGYNEKLMICLLLLKLIQQCNYSFIRSVYM